LYCGAINLDKSPLNLDAEYHQSRKSQEEILTIMFISPKYLEDWRLIKGDTKSQAE
jgi:hypothetical protein